MIQDPEEARRLARALLADAVRYGTERALHDVSVMGEARDLFSARVSGPLQHVFEEERRSRAHASPSGPQVHGPDGVRHSSAAPSSQGPVLIAVAGFVMVFVASLVAFLLAR